MNENNNGRGLFYGVVGVATLIVAIIGATFAYFSINVNMTGNSADNITGTTGQVADNAITGAVTKITTGEGKLIPLGSSAIAQGGEGTIAVTDQRATALTKDGDREICYDKNGDKVCDVYKVVLTNGGDTSVSLAGSFTLTGVSNFRWAFVKDETNGDTIPADLATATVNESTTTEIVNNLTLTPNAKTATYYVVVWLNETGSAQNEDMAKTYTGTINFTAAETGGKITAQF